MMNEIAVHLSDLPPVLSGEQVRTVLHISKRKCAWMLNNGFIKCQNTGKRTRKYAVRLTDLINFIEDSAAHPEKYQTPYAEFSSAKYGKYPTKTTPYSKYGFPKLVSKDFAVWLEKEFKNVPDALTVPEVIAITGYTDNAVDRWLRRGWLKSVQVQTGKIIAKQWLIEFYCNYGYTIAKMSDQHIGLMQKYFKQNSGN